MQSFYITLLLIYFIIAGQIVEKFDNASRKMVELNLTNQSFFALEKQWNEHVEIVSIPATTAGVQMLIDKAEQETDVSKYSYYLKVNIEYLLLNDLRDER